MHRKFSVIVALVALFFVFTAASFAQVSGRISGVVVDRETGDPLMGANVLVVGTSFGAATDMNGEFLILNVPVGTYAVRTTYMGYAPMTIENIRVNIGLTTRMDFELISEAIQTEAVTIVADRPLIEKTATNAARIVTASEIENLPVRGVNVVANLQPGMVAQDGNLYIRGGRDDEVSTYIDGASVRSVVSGNATGTVIPEALEELQIQAGGYEARYGGANSGIIAMAIRAGSPSYQFSVRAETDNFAKMNEKFLDTYSYGYSDYVVTASGPIPGLGNKYRFFVAGENMFMRDRYVRFWEPFEFIHNETVLPDGSLMQLVDSGNRTGIEGDSAASMIWPGGVIPSGASDNQYTYNAVMTADFKNIKFRLSGVGQYRQYWVNPVPMRAVFNTERFEVNETSDFTVTGRMTHIISPKTYYELSVSYHDERRNDYDPFCKNDYWTYHDSVANAAHGFTYQTRDHDSYDWDIYGFPFRRRGNTEVPAGGQFFWKRTYIGAKLDFTHQFKRHQLQFGGEFQYWTARQFVGFNTAGPYQYLYANPDIVQPENREELFEYLGTVSAITYGYDYLGNEDASGLSFMDNARHPTIGAFYVQDRYEWKDLVINAGLRFDYFNMDQYEPANYLNPFVNVEDFTLEEDRWSKVKDFMTLSPRLGFGFPVTDKTVFHMQWGKFVQMPQMTQGYRSQSNVATAMAGGFFYTNPMAFAVRPERTTQYEIGFSQILGTSASFDATLFYRDIKDQLQTRRIFSDPTASVAAYDVTQNGDFATTKGMEFRFTLRRTNRVQGFVNYTYSDARGTGSYTNQACASLDQATNQITVITPLYFNQQHRGTVSVDYRFDKGDGGPILEQIGLNMMFNFNSGHPYTLSGGGIGQNDASQGGTLVDIDARNRRPLEPVGSSTTPWNFTLDARLDKTIDVGRFGFNLYVYVQNVLNTKNVINVFPRTGTDNDGFLNDPTLSGSVIAAAGGAGYRALYENINDNNRQHYLLPNQFRGNDLWSTPRQIRAGVMITFQ